MSYQYFLFDWDGTIAHSLPTWLAIYQQILNDHSVKATSQQLAETLYLDWQTCENYGINFDEFSKKMHEKMSKEIPFAGLHDQVVETLTKLKHNGKKTAVVTSSHRHLIEPALAHWKVTDLFDFTITRNEVTHTKPHPEMVLTTMQKLGAQSETTIMVGDSETDVGAGKAAGITTAVYYPKENEKFYSYEKVKSLNADYIIRHFSELNDIAR